MKKIGILTFHNVPNYGAVLQAYALKAYLENSIGADVGVIDFQCKGNSDEFAPDAYFKMICNSNSVIKKCVKKVLVGLFTKKSYIKKDALFSGFLKNELGLKPYTDTIYNDYDIILCGSDQIWNGGITGGYQLPYFGADRTAQSTAVVASYAASCGDIREFDRKQKEELFGLVRKLDYVAVREKSLEDELLANDINATNTLDPTFLLDKDEYTEALGLKESAGKGFVLEYALRKSDTLDSVAAVIAKQKNIPVVKMCGYPKMSAEQGVFDAGPKDFLSALASADYVVTNSFHGTALSIVFEKDFNVVLPSGRRSRITDLLDRFELSDRICENPDNVESGAIDYNLVGAMRRRYVNEAKQYLAKVTG